MLCPKDGTSMKETAVISLSKLVGYRLECFDCDYVLWIDPQGRGSAAVERVDSAEDSSGESLDTA